MKSMKKKAFVAILMFALILSLEITSAFAGTSIPATSQKKEGSYSGVFNSLGMTPVYYSNYNVRPSKGGAMRMRATGALNRTGATSDYRSGTGRSGNTSEFGSTKLYNFSDVSSSRINSYSNSASTSYYYWSSFNLENRNMVAQLVGTFDFLSPA